MNSTPNLQLSVKDSGFCLFFLPFTSIACFSCYARSVIHYASKHKAKSIVYIQHVPSSCFQFMLIWGTNPWSGRLKCFTNFNALLLLFSLSFNHIELEPGASVHGNIFSFNCKWLFLQPLNILILSLIELSTSPSFSSTK